MLYEYLGECPGIGQDGVDTEGKKEVWKDTNAHFATPTSFATFYFDSWTCYSTNFGWTGVAAEFY